MISPCRIGITSTSSLFIAILLASALIQTTSLFNLIRPLSVSLCFPPLSSALYLTAATFNTEPAYRNATHSPTQILALISGKVVYQQQESALNTLQSVRRQQLPRIFVCSYMIASLIDCGIWNIHRCHRFLSKSSFTSLKLRLVFVIPGVLSPRGVILE